MDNISEEDFKIIEREVYKKVDPYSSSESDTISVDLPGNRIAGVSYDYVNNSCVVRSNDYFTEDEVVGEYALDITINNISNEYNSFTMKQSIDNYKNETDHLSEYNPDGFRRFVIIVLIIIISIIWMIVM